MSLTDKFKKMRVLLNDLLSTEGSEEHVKLGDSLVQMAQDVEAGGGGGGGETGWTKYTYTYQDLAFAATDAFIPLPSIPSGYVFMDGYIALTENFQAPVIESLYASVRTTQVDPILATSKNLMSAPLITQMVAVSKVSFVNGDNLELVISSDGSDNLDTLTAGSFDVYLKIVPLSSLGT
jgi:hypothetical protein